MKFDFHKREAEFDVYNNRRENKGKEKKVVKAIDLPVKIRITAKEIDMLAPVQDGKLSALLYDGKKNLRCYYLSPLRIRRKPEHISALIYDKPSQPLKFEDCKIKDPVVTLEEKGEVYLSFKLQLHPTKADLGRLEDVEMQKLSFECWAEQPDLLDGESDQDDDEKDEEDDEDDDD